MTVLELEPVSPELVLVSPPEVARRARTLLPDPAAPRPAMPRPVEPRRAELAAVWLISVLVTVGPLVLAILVSPGPQ